MRLFLLRLAAVLILVPALVAGQSASRDRRPNFEGTWNSATTTPLERPQELQNKPFFTPAEAAEWDREFARRN
ncbi:MAG: hypothetical protein ABI665_21415, partial [Vicinamibacterales bacterium]